MKDVGFEFWAFGAKTERALFGEVHDLQTQTHWLIAKCGSHDPLTEVKFYANMTLRNRDPMGMTWLQASTDDSILGRYNDHLSAHGHDVIQKSGRICSYGIDHPPCNWIQILEKLPQNGQDIIDCKLMLYKLASQKSFTRE